MSTTRTTKQEILDRFELFQGGTGGLDSWLGPQTPPQVFQALEDLQSRPLSRSRLNQLLTLAHEAPISESLFEYYWLSTPSHPYDTRLVPHYHESWDGSNTVHSIDQLYWGLYRFYVDALLYFGSIRTAYQQLRLLSRDGLHRFFSAHMIDDLSQRAEKLPLSEIAKDSRYLISEMACKSFDIADGTDASQIEQVLTELFEKHVASGGGPITARELITGDYATEMYSPIQAQLQLSSDEFSDEQLIDQPSLLSKIRHVASSFAEARNSALANTSMYLSMVGDLDVYIATSMRNRQDFRDMANFCEAVFSNEYLKALQLRYFDPTMSAAQHHEDKGLIECLMVKCAKALILNAGSRDSYGKDAEAAMALSLGKPVIIFANEEFRSNFFRDVHPLSRLINFETGVAIGAMVATSETQVADLLHRIFTNTLEYELVQPRPKYLALREKSTQSVVRLQTSDILLRETFWNHYHNRVR